jgi:hypothetical protein
MDWVVLLLNAGVALSFGLKWTLAVFRGRFMGGHSLAGGNKILGNRLPRVQETNEFVHRPRESSVRTRSGKVGIGFLGDKKTEDSLAGSRNLQPESR